MVLNYFHRAKSIILSPRSFFATIAHERGLKKPLFFYITTVAITLFVYVAIVFISKNVDGDPIVYYLIRLPFLAGVRPLFIFLLYWVSAVSFSTLSVFLNVFLMYLLVRIFYEKRRYVDVYKMYVYSVFPVSFNVVSQIVLLVLKDPLAHALSFIFSVGFIIWFLILFIKGLKSLR